MELTNEMINKLKTFKFRYAERVSGNIFKIQRAKTIFPNPVNAEILHKDTLCFWHDDCCDHRCCIKIKDILMF